MKKGPLAGAEGILARKKDKFRIVLSIDLIMRSVAVEVRSRPGMSAGTSNFDVRTRKASVGTI